MKKIPSVKYYSEDSIIEGCKKHDRHAQQELYNNYHRKMMAICMRYLQNEEEAFDVLNRAFFKIFDKIHQFKPETHLEAWMRRIVINTIIDYIRENKMYKKNFIRTDEFTEYGEPELVDDDISKFWDKAISIPQEVLFTFINELPPATNIVFNLYAIEEYNHKQIAQQLNISEGTSKWHLSNARKLLKEKLINYIKQHINNNEDENRKFKEH